MKQYLILGTILMLFAGIANAQTTAAVITSDETWSGTVIIGQLTINAGVTVTVQPGTQLIVSDTLPKSYELYTLITVNGKLNLNGTETAPILFRGYDGWENDYTYATWVYIGVEYSGAMTASWTDFDMSYETMWYNGHAAPLYMYQCRFINNANGGVAIDTEAHLIWCTWINGNVGVSLAKQAKAYIDNAMVRRGNNDFVRLNGNECEAYINHLTAKTYGSYGVFGIYKPGAKLSVKNSIFNKNSHIVYIGELYFKEEEKLDDYSQMDIQLDYNIAYNLTQDAFGVAKTSELRVPFVPKHNENMLETDPLFVDNDDATFFLQPNSPAINAGDPSEQDPDGSRTDIGTVYYRDLAGVEESITIPAFSVLANPVKETLTIRLNDHAKGSEVIATIYDISGKICKQLPLNQAAVIDVNSLTSGLYFLRIGNTTQSFVKIK